MPYLQNKPRATAAWLPTQVEYGMDCSDPDPANWRPFGRLHEAQLADAAKHGPKKTEATSEQGK